MWTQASWQCLRALQDGDETVHVRVEGFNRGGLRVKCGAVDGFVPTSQFGPVSKITMHIYLTVCVDSGLPGRRVAGGVVLLPFCLPAVCVCIADGGGSSVLPLACLPACSTSNLMLWKSWSAVSCP